MNNIQQEAFLLDRYGHAPVPLAPREKYPLAKNWCTREFSKGDFKQDSNIGVILGRRSGGLVDIDLDDPVALELADKYLPPTHVVTGRASAPLATDGTFALMRRHGSGLCRNTA